MKVTGRRTINPVLLLYDKIKDEQNIIIQQVNTPGWLRDMSNADTIGARNVAFQIDLLLMKEKETRN